MKETFRLMAECAAASMLIGGIPYLGSWGYYIMTGKLLAF